MYSQEYNLGPGAGFSQSIDCLYPIEFRHRNVSDNSIRLQFSRSFDKRFTVLHTPDNIVGWFQETSD